MEQIILSKKNCHRAVTIKQFTHPESGEWSFVFRGKKYNESAMHCDYAHLASRPGDETPVVIYDYDLSQWEVVSWKYEINFEDFWDTARRAFEGTSHVPEERAAYYIREYEKALNEDLARMPGNEKEHYTKTFRDKFQTLLFKRSRVMSSMITGPARFPDERNARRCNAFESAAEDLDTWREKALQAIARRIELAKPQEQKFEEKWELIKYHIDNCYITANLYNKLETIARKGEVELMQRAIAYVRELNRTRPRPIFTERHKFFKLDEVARAAQCKLGGCNGQEPRDVPFEGGIVRFNYTEDRLQVIFDEKPDEEMRNRLHKEACLKWAPSKNAWQRQLTSNAIRAVKRVLNLNSL